LVLAHVFELGELATLLNHLKRHWLVIVTISVSALSASELRVYVPVLIGRAVESVLTKGASSVFYYAFLIVLVSGVAGALQFVTTYGGQWLAQKVVYQIRKELFDSILSKSVSFHDSSSTGDLIARSTMDIEAIRRLIGFGAPQFMSTTFLIIASGFAFFGLGRIYGLVYLLTLPILLCLTFLLAKKQERFWGAIREKYGKMSKILQENIAGQKLIRSYAIEEDQVSLFEESTRDYVEDYKGVSFVRGVYTPLLTLTVSVAVALLLMLSGELIRVSEVGALVAAVNLYGTLLSPIRFYGQFVLFLENGRAGLKRVYEIERVPDEKIEESGLEASSIKGEIEFQDVWLEKSGKYVLRGINLKIRAGEVVALVGESGSGKTTLIDLIPRFYEPTHGRVLLDCVDIKRYNLRSLRRNVGVVSQDVFLFSGTLRDNICFGVENVSEEQLKNAVELAQLSEFVDSLPDGFDTLIGERGITLSGGQRQRVAIARTLLVNPKIIILDESTSSLDAQTERKLQEAIRNVISGRTTIIISHRLSTLRLAQRVVVLKNGEIVEQGSLNELLTKGRELRRVLQLEALSKV